MELCLPYQAQFPSVFMLGMIHRKLRNCFVNSEGRSAAVFCDQTLQLGIYH